MQKTILVILLILTLVSIVSVVAGSDVLFNSLAVIKDGVIVQDLDRDGTVDIRETWDRGDLTLVEQDTNGDGAFDALTRFRDGEITQTEYDLDFDGQFDFRESWQRDGRHLLEVFRDGSYETVEAPLPVSGQ